MPDSPAPGNNPPPTPPATPAAPAPGTTLLLEPAGVLPHGPVIIPVIRPPLGYTQKVLIAVGISAVVILLTILAYFVAEILVLCFAGLLLAVFLSAPSDLLARYARIKRSYALLVVMVGLAILILGGGYFMGYTVYQQTRELARTLPGALRQFEGDLQHLLPGESLEHPPRPATAPAPPPPTTTALSSTQTAIDPLRATSTAPATTTASTLPIIVEVPPSTEPTPRTWLAERLIQLREAVTSFFLSESFVRRAGGVAGGVVSSTFGIIGNVAVVLGVGLFLAMNPSLYAQGIVNLVPFSRRPRTAAILSEVGIQLQWWFVGQLCSMISIGLLTFVGLSILHVPMAVTLGIIAGLMNFIPNFGPILAAAPAVLVAFAPHGDQTQLNPALAGWVILLYICIQLLEGWVITPFFQQRAVELPPALIIISQVVFGLLLGPIGLILATPILATIIVLVRMMYMEDVLGDTAAPPRRSPGDSVPLPPAHE
jgi:predicted PurR-regulated permease PerM